MYNRTLQWPKNTSFLFGPRGTGKSTWIKLSEKDKYIINLLDVRTALRFERSPELFRQQILAEATTGQWIVVDEIQKVPALLDQVHICIEDHGYKNFLLTGSSARKLRKTSANLLGGRARKIEFFALTSQEMEFSINASDFLTYGGLPEAVNETDTYEKEQYLIGYLENYLIDEIKRESQLRNLAGFQRFLEIAAICSAQPVNLSNIARDAGISRDSVRNYFELLEDTLIGHWLPAFRNRVKVKEVAAPKFYFFDSGVLNAAAGYFSDVAPSDWVGVLMETWLFHEIRAYQSLYRIKGNLSYWRTPSGSEVDFVWKYGDSIVLLEIKAAKKFHKKFLTGIKSFKEEKKVKDAYIVYCGEEALLIDDIRVIPVTKFLKLLYQGEILK